MKHFSIDWFTEHIPVWNAVLGDRRNQRVLEIGSLEGRSALWFLERVINEDGHIWCVDPWEPYPEFPEMHRGMWKEIEDNFDQNVKGYANLTKIKAHSSEALPYLMGIIKTPFDIIYVDGSHMTKTCLMDMVMGWEMLAVGGIMIVDDYEWDTRDKKQNPKLAANSFIECYEGHCKALYSERQVMLKKLEVA